MIIEEYSRLMVCPRVSIIVPCYNYGRFVVQAVDSLLSQTLQDLEIIVIDDASTDDTVGMLARYASEPRVRVIRHDQNRGHIRTYNEGFSLAKGEYLGLLSADDYCLRPDAIARQVAIFDENPAVGMVYAAHVMVEPGNAVTTVVPWPEDRVLSGLEEFRALMWGNYILHSGTLLRRDVYNEVGPYDTRLTQAGDWDLWLRAAARHDVGYIAEPLFAYRIHGRNMQGTGIPPCEQADQNVRVVQRAFAALPVGAPEHIQRSLSGALNHALLQTAWFDLFNGRRVRAWQGLASALQRRPHLVLGAEVWRLLPRLLLLSLTPRAWYRRADAWLANRRGQQLPTAA